VTGAPVKSEHIQREFFPQRRHKTKTQKKVITKLSSGDFFLNQFFGKKVKI
jgi:hypothetical protein